MFLSSCFLTLPPQRLSGSAYCFSASLPAMLAVSASEALSILSASPSLLTDLQDRARVFRATLTHRTIDPLIELYSADPDSPAPFFHLRARESFLLSRLRDGEPAIPREDEERLLQDVVDECAVQGVLITRAKYVVAQEMQCPRPSVRVCVSAAHTKKENEKAAAVVKAAVVKVFGRWRK